MVHHDETHSLLTPNRAATAAFTVILPCVPLMAGLAWSFAMTYIHGRISVDAHLAHRPEAPRHHGLRARDYVQFGIGSVVTGLQVMLEEERAALTAPANTSRRRAAQKVASRAG